ncbi:MAG: LLM class flavin-dependent oxidoreductase [Archaeoglobales archaeon]|nr:LLM class flavin-dependent oxidoreductase [Archaeoglobales archaeon]
MKFGMLISPPLQSIERALKIAEMSEEAGFDSLVVPDHTLMVPPGYTPSAMVLLSLLASKTQKVSIGTGVTDVVRYHPSILAQFFATLENIAPSRIFLGLGAGEAMNIKPFGINWEKPLSTLREGIEVIKKLWSGERFSYDGKVFRMRDAFLQVKPTSKMPIYLGANGKKSRELCGELCDGWMPIAETPKTYKENLEDVKRGAERAGRSIDEIDTALQIYTAIDEDRDKAIQRARQFAGVIFSAIEKAEQAGYNVDIPKDISKKFYFDQLLVRDDMLIQFLHMSSYATDEMIEDFFIAGNPQDCEQKIEEFRKVGVKHLMIINVGPDPKFVLKVFKEKVIPSFR